MTDKHLNEIEARANAASPGPWGCKWVYRGATRTAFLMREEGDGWFVGPNLDATFIAHARQDVPALIAEVRRLQAERKEEC
jgi:hypothetical protein